MSMIAILGDICPDNDYRPIFDSKTYGPFDNEIVSLLGKMDLVVGNLECPVNSGYKPIKKSGPNLSACPNDLVLLKNAGIDIISLANNHILDYGERAVLETIDDCKKCGLIPVGAGKDNREAALPIQVKSGSHTIGIISFAEEEFNIASSTSAGANHFDPYYSLETIGKLKKESDYVIVLYHGGIEYYKYPSPLLQKKCRIMIKAGADLVVCQHSHCIGTIEKYGGGSVIYGQGNSVFGYRKNNDSWNEGLLILVDTDICDVQLRVLDSRDNGVFFAEKEKEKSRIALLREDSKVLESPSVLEEKWGLFCNKIAPLDLPLLYGKSRVFIKLNRILDNLLANLLISKKKQMVTMNLLRCEAHHEVIKTILENRVYEDR